MHRKYLPAVVTGFLCLGQNVPILGMKGSTLHDFCHIGRQIKVPISFQELEIENI